MLVSLDRRNKKNKCNKKSLFVGIENCSKIISYLNSSFFLDFNLEWIQVGVNSSMITLGYWINGIREILEAEEKKMRIPIMLKTITVILIWNCMTALHIPTLIWEHLAYKHMLRMSHTSNRFSWKLGTDQNKS